ncbi:hypothetical protein [Prosthecobacter sp.]|uniref:hypothetical protein n=1 Tax=Prosthecobacter sp. TaxID=1965333 RepID=UPI003784866D
MRYWLSKRRIATRVPSERGCTHDPYCCFSLLRCPACKEIYLAELELERLYTRRGLRKGSQWLNRFLESGCLKCGHVDTSEGCREWFMDLDEVRASWWKWALPSRLRRNRHKRAVIERRRESAMTMEQSTPTPCDERYIYAPTPKIFVELFDS